MSFSGIPKFVSTYIWCIKRDTTQEAYSVNKRLLLGILFLPLFTYMGVERYHLSTFSKQSKDIPPCFYMVTKTDKNLYNISYLMEYCSLELANC